MKNYLNQLYKAGIRRARFTARFQLLGQNGYIGLQNVETPVGTIESHVWIDRGHWAGTIPDPGARVQFTASIEPYRHEDGSEDIGLNRVTRLK